MGEKVLAKYKDMMKDLRKDSAEKKWKT